ncbi:MAG: hypothetical protein EHM35_09320 [Planctomycetaceae bacterium]|nr:MAG: hypothetical protein EHM35_09320 [Planctomycetaceae bacterium]
MSLLIELGSLVEGWGHGSMATSPASIQLGRWSGKPQNLVALITTLGRRADRVMGEGLAGTVYDQPHVQVYVRRLDPLQAFDDSWDLYNKFNYFHGTVQGARYALIEAINPPFSMGVTENDNLMQYSFNLHVRRAPTP